MHNNDYYYIPTILILTDVVLSNPQKILFGAHCLLKSYIKKYNYNFLTYRLYSFVLHYIFAENKFVSFLLKSISGMNRINIEQIVVRITSIMKFYEFLTLTTNYKLINYLCAKIIRHIF